MSQLRLRHSSRFASSLERFWRSRWNTVWAAISLPPALSAFRSLSDMTPSCPTVELMMKKVAFMPRLDNCCAAAICEGRPSSNVNETVVLGAAMAEEENARKATSKKRLAVHKRMHERIDRGGTRRLAFDSTLLVNWPITRPPAASPLLLPTRLTAPTYDGCRESRHRCTGGFRPPPIGVAGAAKAHGV